MQAPSDERRVATVLFADLVGFTTLAERRDPEHVKNLIDACFERLVADVNRFGGRVDKLVGDAIIALFGAPVAHEDDAERAVRCGLAMQRTIADFAAQTGEPLQIRVGVNTGQLLVGALRAGGDYTAMGDVMNAASRLQAAAEAGQVLVGPNTHAATRGAVRYQTVGPLQTKGREQPIEAHVALEAVTPPGHRPSRARTPFLGRDAELALIEQALRSTDRRRRPSLVLLLGEAGLGKSRLAEEAVARTHAAVGALVLEGRCVPYGEANVWWPVAEALRAACGVGDSDPVDVAFAKCKRAVAAAIRAEPTASEVERVAHGLLYVMGHERPNLSLHNVDPQRARDEALRSVQAFIEGLGRDHLVVVVLSELHWADDSVLEFLDRFLERVRDSRLAIVATARPEIESRWTPASGRYTLLSVHLDPLEREAAAELLCALLGGQASPALTSLLIDRSGGNPFFIEELVALLEESGGLGDSHHERPEEIPATLRGLVTARLDALRPGERAALEDAAVVGRTGPVEALVALVAAREPDGATAAVDALAGRDLLVVEDGEYEFKSDLVRDVAYDTLTKAERARRHATVAEWLARRARDVDREDEYLEQIAHHYAVAAGYDRDLGGIEGVPADARQRALDTLLRAADRAESRDSPRLAAHLLEHAWEIVSDEPGPQRRQVLLGLARARSGLRELAAARTHLEAVLTEAEPAGDRAAVAEAYTVLGDVQHREGRSEESVGTLEHAVRLWRALENPRGAANALRVLGQTQIFRGDLDAADDATAEALDLFRRAGDRRGEAWAQQNLAWVAFMRGDMDAAEERLLVAAQTFSEVEDLGGVGWAVGFQAWVRFFQGRLDEAEVLADQILAATEEIGDRWAIGMTIVLAGAIRCWRGRIRDGLARLQEARSIFVEIGDSWGELQSLIPMAQSLTALGRVEEGRQAAMEARRVGDTLTDPRMRVFARGALASIALVTGDPERGMSFARELLEGVEDLRSPRKSEAYTMLALGTLQLGRYEEAAADLQATLAEHPDEGLLANASGILGLALSAAGRPEEAMEAAARVETVRGGTYRDRAVAAGACGLAAARLRRAAASREAFDRVLAIVDSTDSVLDQALGRLARARGLEALRDPEAPEALGEARARLTSMGIEAAGWDRAFRAAAGLDG